ncbi:MAG TPA: hypothetical protein VNZ64_20940 [Candidatus Acidoferrum sp.]|jgi:hypothetical protein|nr:hypothetical protein [Candidatus Acidoferrum sp.]
MTEPVPNAATSVEEIQKGWHELTLRVGQLEAEKTALEQENKALRQLLERVIEHRQKSHGELILLLTSLVSKLPLNDVGVIISKLVEHNTNVSQVLAGLAKGTVDVALPQPTALKTLDLTKRELAAALKPLVQELLQLEAPLEHGLVESLVEKPDLFFTPQVVRANRCFVKGQVPRERIVRDFGEEALVFFNDMTTDPKLNPHPKREEIVLGFKSEFEALFQQQTKVAAGKRPELMALYQRVQRSKSAAPEGRAQRIAFQKFSFLLELLHYYEHQNTEAADVIFAQRLPALVEQLVLPGPQDRLDEKLLELAEKLLAFVINPDHRHMVINNTGKGSVVGKTLKYVLRLRLDRPSDQDEAVPEFVRHLIPPPPQKAPSVEELVPILRLVPPAMQRYVVRSIMSCDRLRRADADALGRAIAAALALKGLDEEVKAHEPAVSPEKERQLAWDKIKDQIRNRADPAAVAAVIRERLNAKYDAEEIRQSWITLIAADPISLIKIFCQIPYRADGKTDSIARPVIETYVSRLTHEKYLATYKKIVNSLKNMFRAKPDSSTLVNFLALVRWVSPEAANKLAADIGVPVPAH